LAGYKLGMQPSRNRTNTPLGKGKRRGGVEKAISRLEKTGRLRYNVLFVGKQDSRKIIAAINRKRTTDRAQNFPTKNQRMEQPEIKIINTSTWRPQNPHDRFCRQTIFRPEYAPDFLKSYGDPILKKFVDLDHLVAAPTTHLSNDLREVIMDGSLTTRLLDTQSLSEVLFHMEHKSRPSRTVALQLFVKAGLSLHSRWLTSGRPEWGTFEPPIPLMVVVYNGAEDWEGEIWFQDIFPELSDELQPLVPQFRVIFINLRRFKYGNLPGKPETRAIVESMMRTTDGTFVANLQRIMQQVAGSELDEYRRQDLGINVAFYGIWTAQVTKEQVDKAITDVFKRQEAINMIETIKHSTLLEGIEIGTTRGIEIGKLEGKLEEKVNDILKTLRVRHEQVPDAIVVALSRRTDLIALESLFEVALQCDSINEFADALK